MEQWWRDMLTTYAAVMTSLQHKSDMDVSLGPNLPEEESTTDETPTLVTGTSRTTEDTPTNHSVETETEPVVQRPRQSTQVRHPPPQIWKLMIKGGVEM